MTGKKELMNELYDACLITLGAVTASFVGKTVFNDDLGVNTTAKGILKLSAAVGVGSIAVQYLQTKKLVPDDPFK